MAQPCPRRTLHFKTLDEVVEEAETLHRVGHDRLGNWNLAQVSGHLAEWMRFPLDGFPPAPLPIRLMLWPARKTLGPSALRRLLASRSMPSGRPTLPATIPPPGGDESRAIERLRESVARFKAHTGPFHPSPFFGPLDRDQATQLQLIHCAHHLSFLVPKPQGEESAG